MAITRTALGTGQSKTTSIQISVGAGVIQAGDTVIVLTACDRGIYDVRWCYDGTNTEFPTLYTDAIAQNSGNVETEIIRFVAGYTAQSGAYILVTPDFAGDSIAAAAIKLDGGIASPFDKSSTGTGSSDTPSSGATTTTAQADEIIIGAIGTEGPDGDTAGSWGEIYSGGPNMTNGQRLGTTGGGPAGNITISEGYYVVSATNTFTAQKSGITSRDWASAIVTYKAASSGTTVAVSTQSSVLSQQAPVLKYGWKHLISTAQSVVTSLPQATPKGAANVLSNALTIVATSQGLSVTGGAKTLPLAQSAVLSTIAPTLRYGYVYSVDSPQTAVFSVIDPAVLLAVNVNANVQALVLNALNSVATGAGVHSPNALAVTATSITPFISAAGLSAVEVLSLLASQPEITVAGKALIAVERLFVTANQQGAVGKGASLTLAGVGTGVLSLQDPTIDISGGAVLVAVNPLLLTASQPIPDILYGWLVPLGVQAAAFALVVPVPQGAGLTEATVQTLTASQLAALVAGGAISALNAQNITSSQQAVASVSGGALFETGASTGLVSNPTVTVSLGFSGSAEPNANVGVLTVKHPLIIGNPVPGIGQYKAFLNKFHTGV